MLVFDLQDDLKTKSKDWSSIADLQCMYVDICTSFLLTDKKFCFIQWKM